MRFMGLTFGALMSGVFLLTSSGFSAAQQQTPAEIIKMRQDDLKKMGGAMKAIVDQLKSGALDKAVVADAAQKVATYAKELPHWFPKGTGPDAGVKTAAKPEIWAKPADFAAAAAKLAPEADKLVAVAATGDAAAIGAQLKATGAVCGACHKVFRVPPPDSN